MLPPETIKTRILKAFFSTLTFSKGKQEAVIRNLLYMTLKHSWLIHNSPFSNDCRCAICAQVDFFLNLFSLLHQKKWE